MARNLLHKDKLVEFTRWLASVGIEHRPGVGTYQVLQVKPRATREQWEAIYRRDDMPEHLTVTRGLERTVRRFIDHEKREKRHVGS